MMKKKEVKAAAITNPYLLEAPEGLNRDERIAYVEKGLEEERKNYSRIGNSGIWRFLTIILFGATLFTTSTTRYNVVYILFGVLIFAIFLFFYKLFLRWFLALFNPVVKKTIGNKVIPAAVDNSVLFLIPFAVMSLLATYALRWSISNAFVSTGIMAVGAAAAIEVGMLRGKPHLKNTIAASGVSFLFSFGLIYFLPILSKVPGWIDGLAGLIPTLLGRGGAGI